MRRFDRERVVRTLTFWLRPAFVLRVARRFQRIVGFDRAMALASTAVTGLVALALLLGPLLTALGHGDTASRIIARYSLTGGGAEAVQLLFTAGEQAGSNILGGLFLLLAVLSFTRTEQRFFEQTWELRPLSVRNTPNALLSAGALAVYLAAAGWLRTVTGDWGSFELASSALTAPVTAGFLLLTGWLLSGRRLAWLELLPFALAGALLEAGYSVAAAVYLPEYFNAAASRYGPVGAVFAMISTLFVVMLILVLCGALGREIRIELARIHRGERPPEGEVRKEWDSIRAEAGERWQTALHRVRRGREDPPPPGTD
jgi:membrane protein